MAAVAAQLVSSIAEEASKFATEIETWTDSVQKGLEAKIAKHRTEMEQKRVQLQQLRAERENLKQTAARLQSAQTAEKQEVAGIWAQVEKLKEQEETVLQSISDLETQIQRHNADIAALKEKMSNEQTCHAAKTSEMKASIELYRSRLGLTFERIADDHLRFVLKHLNKANPEKECYFSLRVDKTGVYEMVESVPAVPNAAELITALNTSNNLSHFVFAMREQYKMMLA